MEKNRIICIGRQYGSDGREIGHRVARELGIPCYDKEIMAEATKNSKIPREILEKHEEKVPNQFLMAQFFQGTDIGAYGKSSSEILYELERELILKKAKENSCIFIGRCADAILADEETVNAVSIFINAPMEDRIHRVMKRENLTEKGAVDIIRRTDKQRKSYYGFYTYKEWGNPSDYDFTINSSGFSTENIVKTICNIFELLKEN